MRTRASHGVSVLTVPDRESPEEETKNEGEEEEAASPEKPTSNGSDVSTSSFNPGAGRVLWPNGLRTSRVLPSSTCCLQIVGHPSEHCGLLCDRYSQA